ncbi:DUF2946 family protein [Acidovorax sp. Leaf160]|uniref:DUF2946 family protein n=1 Tax=Acidovorax sp. Leaf160 TaxID=1736280 RepID=UPI0035168426
MLRALRLYSHPARQARVVLACFGMVLLAAALTPFFQRSATAFPLALAVMCSSGGAVVHPAPPDSGVPAPGAHTLDCPLCLATGLALAAPSACALALAPPVWPVARAAVDRFGFRSGAALPPRGPPA